MSTNKQFSLASFVKYGESVFKPAVDLREAFIKDAKKFYINAGCPSKDEIDILDTLTPELTNIVETVPAFIAGYMHDEEREFNIPAADDDTSPATISVIHKDEETKTGVNSFGSKKGETWTSTTRAHNELKIKNRKDRFKV